jgi:hypothetical protein
MMLGAEAMGFVDQWIYYESARRGPKYHFFIEGAAQSACGCVNRDDERAKRQPTLDNTKRNRCQLCNGISRRQGK